MVLIIIYDIISYIYDLFFDKSSKKQIELHKKSIVSDANFKYDFYKRNAIIDAYNFSKIDTDVTFNNKVINMIDINRELTCDEFIIGSNITVISNLRLKAKNVESKSKYYYVKDGCVFDYLDNLVIIFEDKNAEELIQIANKYSVSKKALSYFSNAKYNQFALYKNMFELRFSKPYYENEENLEAICPNVIEGHKVEALSINYSNCKNLYISKNIERIVIEKKSQFECLKINEANPNFVIFNKTLLNKNTGIFVTDGINTFNLIGVENKSNLESNYRLMNKHYLNFKDNIYCYTMSNQTANDLH